MRRSHEKEWFLQGSGAVKVMVSESIIKREHCGLVAKPRNLTSKLWIVNILGGVWSYNPDLICMRPSASCKLNWT
jgi:hypothetical protein